MILLRLKAALEVGCAGVRMPVGVGERVRVGEAKILEGSFVVMLTRLEGCWVGSLVGEEGRGVDWSAL